MTIWQSRQDASNQAAFTADYGAVTSTTRTIKDTFTNTDVTQHVFGQTVTIKASYKDLQGKKLAFTAKTGTGASHTKYYGDGDKNGVSNYAARIFKNTSYQDACFASPNESLSKSASVTATAQGTGSIKIHKYSANPEIIDGNACYSLKGAEFGWTIHYFWSGVQLSLSSSFEFCSSIFACTCLYSFSPNTSFSSMFPSFLDFNRSHAWQLSLLPE